MSRENDIESLKKAVFKITEEPPSAPRWKGSPVTPLILTPDQWAWYLEVLLTAQHPVRVLKRR